jgi:hypothetical protein
LVNCLIALGAITAVAVLVLAIGGWYLYRNFTRLATQFAGAGVIELVEESGLDEQEKQAVKVQIQRVIDGARRGEISGPQLERIAQGLATSPVMAAIPVIAFRNVYLERSGLDAAQRAEVAESIQRVAHGVMQRRIEQAALDDLLSKIATRQPNGPHSWQFPSTLSDAQILDFAQACDRLAESKGITEQTPAVNLSEEIRRIIDQGLAEAEISDGLPAN